MASPYEILGVPKSASEADIKKAFRNLAKKHHPDTKSTDKGGVDKAAQKKFQEISGAYDILGDKEKRAKYDAGEIDEMGNPRGFDPRGGGGFRGGPFGGSAQGGGAQGGDRDFHFTWAEGGDQAEGFRAEDIFSDLLGGLGGGRRGRGGRNRPMRGDDYALQVTISFEEAARGGTRRVTMPDAREVDVRIPSGVTSGQSIRLRGQGGQGANGGPNGDVILQVTVAPHPYYVRDGNDIRMDLPISLQEAVLGGKVEVPTLTGTVALSVPPNSNTSSVLRLRGKGIPARSSGEQAGDLYVKLVVNLPDKPDAELKAFVETWGTKYDPRAKLK